MGNRFSSVTPTSTPSHLQRSAKTKSIIFTFEDFTHDAPNDEDIRRETAGLQLAILEHVREYYHTEQAQQAPEALETIILKERDRFPGLTSIELAHLLCDARTRVSALVAWISYVCLQNISFTGSTKYTLLPPSVVALIKEMGVEDSRRKLTEEDELAFTQWRAVTAHLLPRRRKLNSLRSGPSNDRIERLVEVIDDMLRNFVDSKKVNSDRLRSLSDVVSRAAVVGNLIFASPSRWEFDWHPSRRDLRERDRQSRINKPPQSYQTVDREGKVAILVQFPALVQILKEDPKDPHAPTGKRSRGDYDDRVEVLEILRQVRQFSSMANAPPTNGDIRPPEPVDPMRNEPYNKTPSPKKSRRRRSKQLRD